MQHADVNHLARTQIIWGGWVGGDRVAINYSRLIGRVNTSSAAADYEIYVHKSVALLPDNEAGVSH